MRFVADVMLGKLSRFLRMLGHDVLYFERAEDDFLIYTCKETARTLITKDRVLHKAARSLHLDSVLINSNYVREQLKELQRAKGLSFSKPTRCITCNGPLIKREKYEIERLVPDFVWHRNRDFWQCKTCGKVYWDGSHTKNFVRFLGFNPWEES